MAITAAQAIKELKQLADPAKAKILARFFKTGPGEYGEGDVFVGLVVPKVRLIAKKYQALSLPELKQLITHRVHEFRLTGLLILVLQFQKAADKERRAIVDFYLAHKRWINNWDLVDLTAEKIVGEYLYDKDPGLLFELIGSKALWDRRIGVLSTFAFIKKGRAKETLAMAKRLLQDREDLMHKAVGWMLREVGKRCGRAELLRFLDQYAARMPRTMLRYAIEHLPEKQRKYYLNFK